MSLPADGSLPSGFLKPLSEIQAYWNFLGLYKMANIVIQTDRYGRSNADDGKPLWEVEVTVKDDKGKEVTKLSASDSDLIVAMANIWPSVEFGAACCGEGCYCSAPVSVILVCHENFNGNVKFWTDFYVSGWIIGWLSSNVAPCEHAKRVLEVVSQRLRGVAWADIA